MTDYTLYGAPFSYYSGKLRAYLVYKGIPYHEVLSTLKVFRKVVVPQTGVRFIPVLKTPDGRYLQDTAVIIDAVEQMHPERPVIPRTPRQLLVSKLFELYGDEWLLIPAMHYRWNRGQELGQQDFIFSEFGKLLLPRGPGFMQRFLGRLGASRFRNFVPRLGITENTIPAIEKWYESEFLAALEQHFSEHDYLLGRAASIGDFGLMGPLYAHLYRDPWPGQLMREQAPQVARWVERMNTHPESMDGWLDNDEIPTTLSPILKSMFSDFFPVLASTVRHLEEWREAHPNDAIPRFIGEHEFHIGETRGTRLITPFSQWKLQRVLEVYQSFAELDIEAVDGYLAPLGGVRALDITINHWLTRKHNKLVWQDAGN